MRETIKFLAALMVVTSLAACTSWNRLPPSDEYSRARYGDEDEKARREKKTNGNIVDLSEESLQRYRE